MPKVNDAPPKPRKGKKIVDDASAAQAATRPVVFPDYDVKLRLAAEGTAVTADYMKELLGWEEETEGGAAFGDEHVREVSALYGKKVRMLNNIHNRPIYPDVLRSLRQVILRKQWRMNGEPMIIGKTGLTLSMQHRGIALILARQEWKEGKQSLHWQSVWDTEPVLDTLIVYGIDESDETVNTLDTGKGRNETDVFYRSQFFADLPSSDRKVAARICHYAVKMLWERTGHADVGFNAFSPKRTMGETLDFVNRHPKLLDVVRHIFTEDKQSAISAHLSPGYSTALCYLMATSASDSDSYRVSDPPCEVTDAGDKVVDFSHWDKAMDFWVLLAAGGAELKAVRQGLKALVPEDGPMAGQKPPLGYKLAVIVNGWREFVQTGTTTDDGVSLNFIRDEGGIDQLTEPVCGGIDLGPQGGKEPPAPKPTKAAANPERPTAEELADKAANGKATKPSKKPIDKEAERKRKAQAIIDQREAKKAEGAARQKELEDNRAKRDAEAKETPAERKARLEARAAQMGVDEKQRRADAANGTESHPTPISRAPSEVRTDPDDPTVVAPSDENPEPKKGPRKPPAPRMKKQPPKPVVKTTTEPAAAE